MALPSWVIPVNVYFGGTLSNAAVIKDVASVKSVILWDPLSVDEQATLTAAVDANGGTVPLPAPTTGYQTIGFSGAVVAGNPTGLVSGFTYSIAVTVDGVDKVISILGSAASTFANLVSEINTDLGAAATASIVAGDIRITSATTGIASTVDITNPTLFRSVTGYVGRQPTVPGAVDFDAVMEVAEAPSGATLSEVFKVILVGLKPPVPSFCPPTSDFIYWDGANWLYLIDDTAFP